MMDLADVHHRGHAGVDLRDAGEKLVDVDVLRPITHRQLLENGFVIIVRAFGPPIVDENAVGEKTAQRRLELMAMRIDEARHDDMPGRVDDGGVGRVDPGGDLGDFRSVDEHVADRVIADALVHRQDCPALDQRAATLNADALGHGGRCRAMRGFKVDRRGAPQVRRGRGCCGEAGRGACAELATRRPHKSGTRRPPSFVQFASPLADGRASDETYGNQARERQLRGAYFELCLSSRSQESRRTRRAYCPRLPRTANRTASSAARNNARALSHAFLLLGGGEES